MTTIKQTLAYSISALALAATLASCGNTGDAHSAPPASEPAQATPVMNTSIWNLLIDGILRARIWAGPEGRTGFQATIEGMSSAVELWPAPGLPPHKDSLGEITLNRFLWPHDGDNKMERLNISAMVDETDNGAYRIGVEASNGGIHRDIIFCFEDAVIGQPSNCPFKITPHGVFVKSVDGTYKQL